MRAYLPAVAAVALTGGCVSLGGKSTEDITNAEWRAVAINGHPAVSTQKPASLLLGADGRASGSGGCNQWFSTYRSSGQAISFGQVGSTRMGCDGPVSEQEKTYFDILRAVDRYSLGNARTLTLSTPRGQTIIYRR
jgi:heat shock protein HslJ